MQKFKTIFTTTGGVLLLVVAIVCLNIIASRLYGRFDTTGDKVFSLSAGTQKILEKLSDDVTVKLYFSRSEKDLPVVIKTYATRVQELLQEYAGHSHGKLKLEIIDPKPDTDEEEWAGKYGITGVRLPKGDQMYFGAVFLSGSKEVAIPYMDPRREEFLEYDLSEALVNIFHKEKGKVGILSSLPVGGGQPNPMTGEGGEAWVFVNNLRRSFDVSAIQPTATSIPNDVKVLLVVHPKNLSDGTLYAIDQYVLHGGRLIVAVDPMSRVDLAGSGMQARMTGQMPTASSSLDKLFDAWGIDFDKSSIVGDASEATQINAGGVALAYPYFLSLDSTAFATDSVITSNLKQMLYAEGGAISAKPGTSYRFDPLIKTTTASGTASTSMVAFMNPQDMAKELQTDGKDRVLAALIRGKFKSAFPQGKPAPAAAGKTGAGGDNTQHLSEATAESSIVIIADTDFLFDGNAVEKFRFGDQVMARLRNDNLNFISNAVDYLGGSEDLISIRSHGHIARPFTRVAALQRQAQQKWKADDDKLTAQLQDLQKKLSELQQQRTDGNRFVLSSAQQSELDRFRDQEREVRRQRREVRKNLREDIEKLGHRLIAANMLFLPLAVSGFGLGVFFKRARRTRRKNTRR